MGLPDDEQTRCPASNDGAALSRIPALPEKKTMALNSAVQSGGIFASAEPAVTATPIFPLNAMAASTRAARKRAARLAAV